MKYCSKCGAPVRENANFCENCGTPQNQAQYTYAQSVPRQINNGIQDEKSFAVALLGFLIPIAGLILYIIWKDEKPLKAKSAIKGAAAAIIIGIVLGIFAFVLSAFVIGKRVDVNSAITIPPEYYDIDDFPDELLRIFNPIL